MLCNVLMDQAIMHGVGNITKNEALFNYGLYPAVKVGNKMIALNESKMVFTERFWLLNY